MGFSSHDDFLNKVTVNGKFLRLDWNKLSHSVAVQAAGEWHSLFGNAGNPSGSVEGGTNLSFQTLNDQATGALPLFTSVAPDTRHIINVSAFSAAATSCPTVLMLVDLLGYYPITSVTTTGDQYLINSATFIVTASMDLLSHPTYDIANYSRLIFTSSTTLPAPLSASVPYWTVRQSNSGSKVATSYENAKNGIFVDITDDGVGTHTLNTTLPRYESGTGVQSFLAVTTVVGAATPSIKITYTPATGSAGAITPGILPIGKTAASYGLIPYSGTGAGKYGPFFPLAQGANTGISKIERFSLSVSYVSGRLALFLCKPILSLPLTTIGVAAERDLLNQLPSLPQVQDGACLAWLMYAGAATPVNTGYYGHIDFGWG